MMIIKGRERDLGGFSVKRVLPYALHRMVGPFIFFDHMGPVQFAPGSGIDVRPHPHINLATVTYLFEGVIHHRDSLGSDQLIEPGAMNWMTAGTGVVHSERTPESLRQSGQRLDGIQLWVALPTGQEEIAPSFTHHPKETFSSFELDGVSLKLLLGTGFNRSSPVRVMSDMIYAEARMPAGARLKIPAEDGREVAVYVARGSARSDGAELTSYTMAVAAVGEGLEIEATSESIVMILGGRPLGERKIFWNFVSSEQSRIDQAKHLWARGPQYGAPRFYPIRGDDKDFVPLPAEVVK